MKKFYIFILLASFLFSVQPLSGQVVESVVGWTTWVNFTTLLADQGTATNKLSSTLNAIGAGAVVFSDVDGNGTSQQAYALGFDNGAGTKSWQFQLSTLKYSSLTFSCRMSGTNNFFNFLGPRDFKLQYSTNGSTWIDVSGGTL
ncbi:MAG: hypothetical protein ABIN89_27285 [Chitinophagaceae bacterium]